MKTPELMRIGVDTETDIDFDAHYTVSGLDGVSVYLVGYDVEWTQEEWIDLCTENGHKEDDHADPENPLYDVNTFGEVEYCGYWQEPEQIENKERVRYIMVGDDRIDTCDVEDLTKIDETDFCRGCGQTGCTAEVTE